MNHSVSVNSIWSYLPAFRAVAETEHLPSAARELHVVPSALSRSVRLLEEALGSELFVRRGRRLFLNARGRALLDALRQGMTAFERAIARSSGEAFEGELKIGAIGVLTNHVVLPVLLALLDTEPRIVPQLRACGAKEANHRLMIGALDAAFYYDAVPLEGVFVSHLGTLGASIYCGRSHPLFRERRIRRATVLRHAFSVPQLGDRNVPMDGWPVHVERRIGFRIELLQSNLEVCLSGRFLTVLPDVIASPFVRARRIRRLPLDLVPAIEVYGACREGEETTPIIRTLFQRVAERAAAVGHGRSEESPRS